MKQLIIFLLFLSSISSAEVVITEEAVETNGIRVEYSTASQRGFIYPINCEQCSKKHYEFNIDIKVSTKGKTVTLTDFLKRYHDLEYPTLLLDPKSLTVVRVVY